MCVLHTPPILSFIWSVTSTNYESPYCVVFSRPLLLPLLYVQIFSSDTLNLCYSLNVRDKVSHPRKQQIKLQFCVFRGWEFFSPPCRHRLWGHPASYPGDTGGCFPGGKAAGSWNWPLTPSSAQVKEWVELYLHSPIHLHGVVLS
jgi:hypothetical protein